MEIVNGSDWAVVTPSSDRLRMNHILVATDRGVWVYTPVPGCNSPAPECTEGFQLRTQVVHPPGGLQVLGIHHLPAWSVSAAERSNADHSVGGGWALLMADSAGNVIVDLMAVRGLLGTPTIEEISSREFSQRMEAALVGHLPPFGSAPTFRGGDVRYRLAIQEVVPGRLHGEQLQVDANLTLEDGSTRQMRGTIDIIDSAAQTDVVNTGLYALPEGTCPSPATAWDVRYWDAFMNDFAAPSGSRLSTPLQAHAVCAAPVGGDVVVAGYRSKWESPPNGLLVHPVAHRVVPLRDQGVAVHPQLTVSFPCAEQLRYQTRLQSPAQGADMSLYGMRDQNTLDRQFMRGDDWMQVYRCSSQPIGSGFPFTHWTAGNVQATLVAGVAPQGTSTSAPLASATTAELVTLSLEVPTIDEQNQAEQIPPTTIRDIVTRTEVPPGHKLQRQPTVDVVERLELTGRTATCLQTASPEEQAECVPEFRTSAPVPIAVMMAPPFVKGTGQEAQANPEFATGTSSTTERSEFTSTTVGLEAGVAMTIEDPVLKSVEINMNLTFSYERESENSVSNALTIFKAEGYGGSLEADTIVVNHARYLEYEGRVAESSIGLGTCDRAGPSEPCASQASFIRAPIGNSTSTQTLADLRSNPESGEWWGPDKEFGRDSNNLLPHVAGMPGTYLGSTGDPDAELNEYCIGDLDPAQGFAEVRKGKPAVANPFTGPRDALTELPQILTSQWTDALASSDATTRRASIGFATENSESFLASHSMSANFSIESKFGVGVKGGPTFGVSAGGSWGDSFSSSLGKETEFTGYVGSIPDPRLTGEQFGWRMFVCKREIMPGVPVWVQGYQVRDYGGIYQSPGAKDPEDLGPIDVVAPRQSQSVSTTPTLEWEQPVGTVKDYDVELEAVGRFDARSWDAVVEFPDWPTASARGDEASFDVPTDEPLLANQLYRWRVRSNNFFFHTEASSWEYFVTEGAPTGNLVIEDFPGYGVVDGAVKLRRAGSDGGLPVTTKWLVDGVEVASSATGHTDAFDWVPTAVGWHQVSMVVSNDHGSSTSSQAVLVTPDAVDDQYVTDEDTPLVTPAPGVLANDAGATSATLEHTTPLGTLDLRSNGSFDWNPQANACGDAANTVFQYRPSGGGFASPRSAVAAIEVTCVDDLPVALDDEFTGIRDQPLEVGLPGVLANDYDVDLAPLEELTASVVDEPLHIELALNSDGSFVYTPSSDRCGTDRFTYRIHNGDVEGNVATVTLQFPCPPPPPPPPPAKPPAPKPPAPTCPTGPVRVTTANASGVPVAQWVCGMELVGTVWRGEGVIMLLPKGFVTCPAVRQRLWYQPQFEFVYFLLQAKCGYRPTIAQTFFGPWLAWDPPR